MRRFRLSIQAARDIEQIWVYIAEDNFRAGRRVGLQLLEAFRLLARNPQLGHPPAGSNGQATPFLAGGSLLDRV